MLLIVYILFYFIQKIIFNSYFLLEIPIFSFIFSFVLLPTPMIQDEMMSLAGNVATQPMTYNWTSYQIILIIKSNQKSSNDREIVRKSVGDDGLGDEAHDDLRAPHHADQSGVLSETDCSVDHPDCSKSDQ